MTGKSLRGFLALSLALMTGLEARAAKLTQSEFESMAADFANFHRPLVWNLYRRDFNVRVEWNARLAEFGGATNTVSDGAFGIKIAGELVRHPALTPDGLLLVMCHELGHIVREKIQPGSPKDFFRQREMATDYFASSYCLPELWQGQPALGDPAQTPADLPLLPAPVQESCESAFSDPARQALCNREAFAVHSVARFLFDFYLALDPGSPYSLPSFSSQATTASDWPQCSMDVYFAGALLGENPPCFFREK